MLNKCLSDDNHDKSSGVCRSPTDVTRCSFIWFMHILYIYIYFVSAVWVKGNWLFCLVCIKLMIFFSSCGLQKVGWWVAIWSEIQRPHRPFLKSAWYLVTYITPTLLHHITPNRQPIHMTRGSHLLKSALNTRSVVLFQLNHDSQAGTDSINTAPTWLV